MRRYLGEFLSDRRVIDYSPWLWQPLLQLIISDETPFHIWRGLPHYLERRSGRKPADDDHQAAKRSNHRNDESALWRRCHG